MDLLSLNDPSNTCHASQTVQATSHVNLSKSSTGKGEAFQSDHAALLSILQNEGVSAMGLGSATPQSTKPYNYLPQRVSVMKSRQKAGPTTGLTKLVQFSPDAAALRSIIQNEGVKAGGPLGATPRNSVCPSGRGTSIYTAQRVPLTKSRTETAGGPVAKALKETPVMKWTPQRVPNTRHQPMSAMASIHKRLLSAHRTPYAGSPRLRGPQGCNTDLQPHKEEIAQRLFDDEEDEQSTNVTDRDPGTEAEQLPVRASTTESHREQKGEIGATHGGEDEKKEQEQRSERGQPFFQAPLRESVIFLSTGKKLLRGPRFEKQEQQGTISSTVPPVHEETPSVSDPTWQINPSVLSLPRDLVVQKSYARSPAVALLRRRLPPLEELRMDEEVATYTSVSAPDAPGFLPPRPRCGNPLASMLHFQESTRFVPIVYDPSSGPPSPCASPRQER
uniref:uncharacterized protein troap n=1 Tax=Centroberyx gerrardi TaxID=166262 RepID=UPI003AAA2347